MPGKLVHFEIPAKDGDMGKEFYSAVFGWKFGDTAMPGVEYYMTEAGGEPGGALYPAEEQSGILVYFDTDDVDASVAKVREAGGEADDKQPIPHVGWFSHCKDPAGNQFGLFKSDESVTAPGQ